eukprot:TRINITY_DN4224_c0_g1_i3.p1 TRINITY_DN4224_c0_g1~~TRINITY_DN4224_c0_g1_i3.p1  ORF type:complete len:703 (+),score=103.97 TRINITY_DN4224_c0_g1_i3:30-2138(+)
MGQQASKAGAANGGPAAGGKAVQAPGGPGLKRSGTSSPDLLTTHAWEHSASTSASSSSPGRSQTPSQPGKTRLQALQQHQGPHKQQQQLRRTASVAGSIAGRDSPTMPMVQGTGGSAPTRTPPSSRPGTGASIASVAATMSPQTRGLTATEAYRQQQQKERLRNEQQQQQQLPGQLPDIDTEPSPPSSQPATLSFRTRPGTTASQGQLAHLRPSSQASGPGARTVQGHRPSSSQSQDIGGTLQQPVTLPMTGGRRPINSHAQGRLRNTDPNAEQASFRPQTSGSPQQQGGLRRGIRWVEDAAHHYKLGGNVMPSCHSGMEIRHAMRAVNSLDQDLPQESFVVKVRYKNKSFQGRNDEQKWRNNTELILNIPQCNGIARIHEVLEDPKAYYVIMERAGGCDLYECLTGAPEKRLPPNEAKDVMRELLNAVAELHGHGFIHKDLKLENVMLNRAGPKCPSHIRRSLATSPGAGVKLIDFDTVEEWTPESPKAKHVLGTDQYIAPEAYEGMYSPLSDVFAVGVIAYRLLTGTFPYNGRLFDDKPGENWVGSPKMREIRGKLCDARVSFRHPVFETEPGGQYLIQRMLAVREQDRPDARECLNDPWLAMPNGKPFQPQEAATGRQTAVPSVRGRVSTATHSLVQGGSPQRGGTPQRGGNNNAALSNQTLANYWPGQGDFSQNRRKRLPTDDKAGHAPGQDGWVTLQ